MPITPIGRQTLLHMSLAMLVTLSCVTGSKSAQADTGGTNMDRYQINYLREYLSRTRFFDSLNDLKTSPEFKDTSIDEQVRAAQEITGRKLRESLSSFPAETLTHFSTHILVPMIVSTAFAGPELWRLYSQASPAFRSALGLIGLIPATLVANPVYTVGTQLYYWLMPPVLPEANLIRLYGGKKHLLAAATQTYIEENLFYVFWQSPNSDALYRLHKFLNKALRIPLQAKPKHFDEQQLRTALEGFPQSITERLVRLGRTETQKQRMEPRPQASYPLYLHGVQGTGISDAIKHLARSMGKNIATFTLNGANINELIGIPFENFASKPGRLLEALIANTQSSEDITDSEQILVINDFDLLVSCSSRRSEETLSFLLDLLLPSRTEYYNPYLQTCLHLPSTIILTGRSDLTALSSSNNKFETLLPHIEHLHFSVFSPEEKQHMATHTLIPKLENSYRSLNGSMSDFKLPPEDRRQIETFIRDDSDPGLQSLEKFLSDLFEQHLPTETIDAP